MIVIHVKNGQITREVGSLPKGTRRVRLQWWKDGAWHPSGAAVTWTPAEARRQLRGPLGHPKYRLLPICKGEVKTE